MIIWALHRRAIVSQTNNSKGAFIYRYINTPYVNGI